MLTCHGLYPSGQKPWSQKLVWRVAPQVKSIQQPIQLLNRQHSGVVDILRRSFKALGLETFEPNAEAVALPIQILHSIPGLVEENEKYRVENSHFYVQLDQGSKPSIDFLNSTAWGRGRLFRLWRRVASWSWLLEKDGSTASGVSYWLEMWGSWSGYQKLRLNDHTGQAESTSICICAQHPPAYFFPLRARINHGNPSSLNSLLFHFVPSNEVHLGNIADNRRTIYVSFLIYP